MQLTAKACETAQPRGQEYLRADGTFHLHSPWRPAPQERAQLLAVGEDPLEDKIEKRLKARQRDLSTFENVTREWLKHESHRAEWSASYKAKIQRMLELHAFRTSVGTVWPPYAWKTSRPC